MQPSLEARLRFLRDTQNPDGGWGFFPGKQSWLEPTAYAMLALSGDLASQPSFDWAWKLMRSWQLTDGSWKGCAAVPEPHWTTSLALTLHSVRKVRDDAFRRGVAWLTGIHGAENNLVFRVVSFVRPHIVELDASLKAWPWRSGSTSWIEPTAHALFALRKAAAAANDSTLNARIRDGEQMIWSRRCRDGGWNYGNYRVLKVDLPSYPETTAIALHGLRGGTFDLSGPVAMAKKLAAETRSPLARAWLALVLKPHGVELTPPDDPPRDVMVAALEAASITGVLS